MQIEWNGKKEYNATLSLYSALRVDEPKFSGSTDLPEWIRVQ